VTESQIFLGFGLTIALAVGCQVVADRFRLPAIVLLLPVGFAAGALTSVLDPTKLLGEAFTPLVQLSVAIILFDSGLDLVFEELEGHGRRIVRRLLTLGIPITWAGAAAFAGLLLGLPWDAALMLGAIVIVSGPTVVGPLLEHAKTGPRLTSILRWEGATIDPMGAIIGVLTFQAIEKGGILHGHEVRGFALSLLVGLIGAAIGTILWVALHRFVTGVLSTEVILALVVAVAAACDAARSDSGLIAAIVMGVAIANLKGIEPPEDRPFFRTIVQLVIGLLFISISATVTPTSLVDVLWPTIALVACLVLVVRPVVALVSTVRTDLPRNERAFVGWMDPRGIVAASTAASFAPQLASSGVEGADKLLPATFLVIVGTVVLYGLTAVPVARALGVSRASAEETEPV
jgi:NhaP-type Na+/H+ or K+/H+ antiporter